MSHVSTNWENDTTLKIADETFRVMDELGEMKTWKLLNQLFIAKRREWLLDYMQVFDDIQPKNIVELGIFHGGSTAFLDTYCQPDRLAAIDIQADVPVALTDYCTRNQATERIQVHCGVDQGDKPLINLLIDKQFAGTPIDLVLDDASHLLQPTRSSFECLFPKLRPGGLYIIEDWNWEFFFTRHLYSEEKKPMAHLIMDLAVTRTLHPEAFAAMAFDYSKITITKGDKELPVDYRLGEQFAIEFIKDD